MNKCFNHTAFSISLSFSGVSLSLFFWFETLFWIFNAPLLLLCLKIKSEYNTKQHQHQQQQHQQQQQQQLYQIFTKTSTRWSLSDICTLGVLYDNTRIINKNNINNNNSTRKQLQPVQEQEQQPTSTTEVILYVLYDKKKRKQNWKLKPKNGETNKTLQNNMQLFLLLHTILSERCENLFSFCKWSIFFDNRQIHINTGINTYLYICIYYSYIVTCI